MKITKDNKGQIQEIFLVVGLLFVTILALTNWIIPIFRTMLANDDYLFSSERITKSNSSAAPINSIPQIENLPLTKEAVLNEINTILASTAGLGANERWKFSVKVPNLSGGADEETYDSTTDTEKDVLSLANDIKTALESPNNPVVYKKTVELATSEIFYTY